MRKRSMMVSILFLLIFSIVAITVNAQEVTVEPVATEEIEITPEVGMTAEVTPEMEVTAEVTPEIEMTAEITPEMEVTAEVTPEIEMTPEVTPEMEVTAEVTPEIEMTPEVTPEIEMTVTVAPVIIATEIGNEFFPQTLPFSQALMDQLTLPEGFEISVFARDLGNPRMMAVSDSGVIYVSRPTQNDIIALFDQNSDGRVDINGFRSVAINIPIAHGLVIQNNQLYIASEKQIFVADILGDGSLGTLEIVTDNLPDGEQHNRRTLDFGPDGVLYVSVGSTCNACIETNPENATIVTVPLDGSARTVFAEGLRNSMGFAWHPETGEMWAMDNGSDWRGDDKPAEELNMIESGHHYGWPLCYENKVVDPFMPAQTTINNGMSNAEFCNTTTAPILTYQAHSAPIDLLFYTGNQFPEDYRDDMFVTMRGSWNRLPATGYKVVRIHFEEGQPIHFSDFVSGFLVENGTSHFARVAGLAIAPDGSLLFTDDTNGIIYRVAYIAQ